MYAKQYIMGGDLFFSESQQAFHVLDFPCFFISFLREDAYQI